MNIVSQRLLISSFKSASSSLIRRSTHRVFSSYEKEILLWRRDRLEAELKHVNKYLDCFPEPKIEEVCNKTGDSRENGDEATPRPRASASGPWMPKSKSKSTGVSKTLPKVDPSSPDLNPCRPGVGIVPILMQQMEEEEESLINNSSANEIESYEDEQKRLAKLWDEFYLMSYHEDIVPISDCEAIVRDEVDDDKWIYEMVHCDDEKQKELAEIFNEHNFEGDDDAVFVQSCDFEAIVRTAVGDDKWIYKMIHHIDTDIGNK
eukprot:scaffold164807_cov23-Cyclotella_meneghiniana.AAC.1